MVCVLIVDDELSVRSTLRHKLEGMGHEVVDASDGRDALRIAEGQRPDIAIVDILMPEMDGIEIIKEFKSKDYRFPIIAMHPQGTERSIWYGNIAKMLGADDVLEKPFRAREVETMVSRLIKEDA